MRIASVSARTCELTMTVRDDMLNGHAICHGGLIFTLADSTFAFACNSYNLNTVASGCAIDFLAPAHGGDVLHATRRRAQPRRAHRRLRHRGHATSAAGPSRCSAARATGSTGTLSTRRRSCNRRIAPCRPSIRSPVTSSRSRRASRDELAALQLERLQWSLRHAYDNVAALPDRRSTRAGVHPDDLRSLDDLAQVSVHDQERPARQLSVRHVRRAARAGRAHPRVVAARPASRRSSATRANDIDTWATVMARSIRAAGGRAGRHRARRLRLRPLHRRPRRALRRREARLHGDADVRRADREAGAADRRLQARHHHGDAVVHAGDRRGDASARASIRARRRCAIGIFGAEPWTDDDARGDRSGDGHRCDRHLRPVGSDRARASRSECIETQGRPRRSGRTTSIRRSSIRETGRRAARRREGRAGVHVAHQGSAADHPLPHARPDAAAAAAPRARCAAWRRSPAAPTTC